MNDVDIDGLIANIESEYEEMLPGTLTADSKFKEVIHWNSMNALVLTVMVEYNYKVMINDQDWKAINTIHDLADVISKKMNHDSL